MNDLISRQAAIKAIGDLPNCYNGYSDTHDKACIIGILEEVPTIDAAPLKHGKWVGKPLAGHANIKCSACGYVFMNATGSWKYCPNCGTKMEEK